MSEQPPGDETRLTLIQRVRALDADGWNEFTVLYDSLLTAYVRDCGRRYQMGLDEHDLDEVKQEVLIKLYHALPGFELDREGRGRFRTWLWRVVHNATIDHVRKRRRGQAADDPAAPPRGREVALDSAMIGNVAEEAPPPDEELIEQHVWDVRRYILQKVKAEMQSSHKWDCFERHILQGRPSAEVAAELAVSVSAVNTYSSRVLARIRQLSAEYEAEF